MRPDAVATQLATGTSLWYSMYSAVYSIMSSVIILRILVLAADTDTNKLRAHAATRQRQGHGQEGEIQRQRRRQRRIDNVACVCGFLIYDCNVLMYGSFTHLQHNVAL